MFSSGQYENSGRPGSVHRDKRFAEAGGVWGEENDSCGISVLWGCEEAAGPRSLGPLEGLSPAWRYPGDAPSTRLERLGQICVPKLRGSWQSASPAGSPSAASHQESHTGTWGDVSAFHKPGKLVMGELKKRRAHCVAYKQRPKQTKSNHLSLSSHRFPLFSQ